MPRPGTLAAPGYRGTVRGRTYPAGRPWIQLDHLLVRGPVRVSAAAVADPVGSDHLPIRAELRVP
jgi:endonuclease/exonuclease/phosphatase family metal-dependent hydrolase